MTTYNHTPITTSPRAAANASTFNTVFAELDAAMGDVDATGAASLTAAIGDLTALGTTTQSSIVAAIGSAALLTSYKAKLIPAINEVYTLAVAAQAELDAASTPYANLAARLTAIIADITDGVVFTGPITGQAATFTGDGSGLTGIATGTGGVTNTGSTTIGADTDQNGVGEIALQTGLVTRMTITAAGDIKLGSIVPKRLNAVYTLGDSLTATPTYPNKLAALLGSPWVVRNLGISGNTTTQMEARIDAHCLNAGDGEYIVILGGINDIAADASAATIEGNLQAMYSAAAAAGLTVIACTITPFKTNAAWSSGRQTVLDAVNAWILGTAIDVDYTVDS